MSVRQDVTDGFDILEAELGHALQAPREVDRAMVEAFGAVIRALANLWTTMPPASHQHPGRSESTQSWSRHGVVLPNGSALRVVYGADIEEHGEVAGGKLAFHGKGFDAPSPAVASVIRRGRGTDVSVNGWLHMHVLIEGVWLSLAALRRDRARQT